MSESSGIVSAGEGAEAMRPTKHENLRHTQMIDTTSITKKLTGETGEGVSSHISCVGSKGDLHYRALCISTYHTMGAGEQNQNRQKWA